jgi:three-Cys-motif partner protein
MSENDYHGREQTKAKHYILKRYLQALAFKVLNFSDVTYVDGFSGPWKSRSEDFSDSSFMIAINVLKDAQEGVFQRTGRRRKIKCFFSETSPDAYSKLTEAVARFHDPAKLFEIRTFKGKFEDAVSDIQTYIGSSFPLIFIDPTGWTGYPFDKIKPLFNRGKCEVLINFMYAFVSRFVHSDDASTIASLDPILGGPGWRDRLEPDVPRGPAVEKLFRSSLKSAGHFDFVVSTKIEKTTSSIPHFFIAYATKHHNGLKTFRQTEYEALREHERNRADAAEHARELESGLPDLFSGHDADVRESTIDDIVKENMELASHDLLDFIRPAPQKFSNVVSHLLQIYMLRETNIKSLCVDLAKIGKIKNSWGVGGRRPRDNDWIKLEVGQ